MYSARDAKTVQSRSDKLFFAAGRTGAGLLIGLLGYCAALLD